MEPGVAREAVGLVGALALVLLSLGVALRALDALPVLISGERPGMARFQSVEAAERALGERVYLPAFFPDTLSWPPATIRVYAGPPKAAAIAFSARDGRSIRLILYQVPGAGESIPMALMPAGRVLHKTEVTMPDGSAILFRLELPGGVIGNDLVWYRAGETLALRYEGPAEELLLIARSLHRRRP
jgi:hypothetical protein